MPDKHYGTQLRNKGFRQAPRTEGPATHSAGWLLALAMVLAATVLPGCGEDQTRRTSTTLARPDGPEEHLPPEALALDAGPPPSREPEPPSLRAVWKALVPPPEPKKGSHTATVVIHLGSSGSEPESGPFAGLELPDSPSKMQVRVYVGTILRVATDKGMFGASDPEVAALARVGGEHVGVLIEPLRYLSHFNGDIYVTEALKALVTEEHKTLVLEHLAAAPELVEVVVDAGWTRDAASTLFKTLARRSPYLNVNWIEAAASVAGPEQYEDLKFHLRHNDNAYVVWQAMRDLPGIEPLEPSIMSAWRGTGRQASYKWGQLAMAAAHYGHMDGLEFVVEKMETSGRARQVFQNLTGYGPDIEFLWDEELKKACAWFAAHKDRLEFDSTEGRYVVGKR